MMSSEKTTVHQLLKSINQQKVLRLIYTEGPISRVELSEKTRLTQQTITNIVNRLLQDDLLLEQDPVGGHNGRKPVPLVVNTANMYAIGIEVAIKYVRGTIMDFQNRIIHEVSVQVPIYDNEEHPLQYIFQVLDELMGYVPQKSRLKGIGLSIQGLVDFKQGIVIYSPGLRWRKFPLRERIENRYGFPVYLENDANLLALVENLNGRLAGSQHNITLKFDYGIGGAIVMNKQLCTGANHVAGEFGHYKAFAGEDARPCHCGAKGCLTTLASVSGLKRNSGYTLDEFDERLRGNDPQAVALFGKIAEAASLAISNLITFFNPDHVLLTGMLIERIGDLFVPFLRKRILETIPESCRGVQLVHLPEKPNDSATAAGLVIHRFFDVPLDQLSL